MSLVWSDLPFQKSGEETGLVEIKCPYKFRHYMPEVAAEDLFLWKVLMD